MEKKTLCLFMEGNNIQQKISGHLDLELLQILESWVEDGPET